MDDKTTQSFLLLPQRVHFGVSHVVMRCFDTIFLCGTAYARVYHNIPLLMHVLNEFRHDHSIKLTKIA